MLIKSIITLLRKSYPGTFHEETDAFKVLISTVLSQRTRDEITYPTAKKLFSKYKIAHALAASEARDLERLISRVGFYRVKAKRIKQISQVLLKKYDGKVPDDISELLTLPGVGRKTANCVLVYAFRKPAIPVDIHVHRITNRLGLVKTKMPEATEKKLTRIIPKKYWIDLNELLVQHGQQVCRPIKPLCQKCLITTYCNYYKMVYKQK